MAALLRAGSILLVELWATRPCRCKWPQREGRLPHGVQIQDWCSAWCFTGDWVAVRLAKLSRAIVPSTHGFRDVARIATPFSATLLRFHQTLPVRTLERNGALHGKVLANPLLKPRIFGVRRFNSAAFLNYLRAYPRTELKVAPGVEHDRNVIYSSHGGGYAL